MAWPVTAQAKSLKRFDYCQQATQQIERKHGIPRNLLRAISLTESGRWSQADKANIAWPWTVASGKAGDFFPTKSEAIKHVRALQAKGVRNIDVGCMQINLRYHPDAFKNLNEAFEPRYNVEYAAKFLTRLFKETKSWTQAAGRYHSSNPERHMYYREKVLGFWNLANRETHEETQAVAQQQRNQLNYTLAQVDRSRMQFLNNAFRDRIDAQKKAMTRAERMAAQVSNYRDSARIGRSPSANAARQKALYRQSQKKLLTVPQIKRRSLTQTDFSSIRAAQLDKWRKTKASPSLFEKSKTTTPETLLTTTP